MKTGAKLSPMQIEQAIATTIASRLISVRADRSLAKGRPSAVGVGTTVCFIECSSKTGVIIVYPVFVVRRRYLALAF
jgi:hypothetical protein